ncbi:hypothetical protein [Streptomyces alboflavus]|uniref:hypothetical protein n=1 Tax=Streptomyces alboflavus TaxID=67267 RepID=UPI0012FEA397|nr:hypothetical protein [Streptomyces alboflavus]
MTHARMGLVELLTDPHTCDHHSCRDAAVMWFEPCAGPDDGRRFYACDGHVGLFAQSVATASAAAGKVV